jgi:hypothetical protein
MTAAVLAEGVARGGGPLVALNLAGDPQDPRRAVVSEAAAAAGAALQRALSPPAA